MIHTAPPASNSVYRYAILASVAQWSRSRPSVQMVRVRLSAYGLAVYLFYV